MSKNQYFCTLNPDIQVSLVFNGIIVEYIEDS
jgi:hypothetical protein